MSFLNLNLVIPDNVEKTSTVINPNTATPEKLSLKDAIRTVNTIDHASPLLPDYEPNVIPDKWFKVRKLASSQVGNTSQNPEPVFDMAPKPEALSNEVEPVDRKLVRSILEEVIQLLKLGKELESLTVEKRSGEAESLRIAELATQLKKDVLNVESSLRALSEKDNPLQAKEQLENVFTAYENYMRTLDDNQQHFEQEDRKKANTLLTDISGKKKEIEKALKSVGDQRIFDEIKTHIKRFESQRPAYLERVKQYEERAREVSKRVIETRNSDPEMFNDFVGRNDILSILQLVYSDNK
jgi:uncharacterized protein YoxC